MKKEILKIILIAIAELVMVNIVACAFFIIVTWESFYTVACDIVWYLSIFLAIYSIRRNIRILNGDTQGDYPFWYTKPFVKYFWEKFLNNFR